MLGLSETAAGTRLHRTLTKLRKACDEHPDDTATIERDLAAVDAALAGGAARDDDPRRPRAPGAGAGAARRRAAAATARSPRSCARVWRRASRARPARLERLAAKAASAAAGAPCCRSRASAVPLLLVVVVVFAAGGRLAASGGGDDDGGSVGAEAARLRGGGGGEAAAGPRACPATRPRERRGADAVAAARAAPPDGGFVPGQRNRKIERSFSLELDVPLDDMARVADEVTAVTNRHGGFVLNSSVNTGEDGGGGDFSLRIPTDRLRPALRDLAELAPVIRQSQEGRDVTREHVTAKDRLQAARARAAQPAAPARGGRPPTRRRRRSGAGSTWSSARSTACARSCATCGCAPTTRS